MTAYRRDNDNMGQDMLNMTGQFVRQWEQLDDYLDQEQVQAAQNRLISQAQQRGDLSALTFDDVNNIYDMRALGLLQQQNSQNEQYRLQGMKNRDASDSEFYSQKIYPTMSLIEQAYAKGDTAAFDALTQQLSNLMGTPYRYKPTQDGSAFEEYFRSNDGMGFAPTGRRMSRDDIYKVIKDTAAGTQFVTAGIGGQKMAVNPNYNMWAERQRMATARGNIEAALNPKPMIGPDGRQYLAAPQNKWSDYNADTDVVLFDAASGKKVGVYGASQLGRQGFRWPNKMDETNMADQRKMQMELFKSQLKGQAENARYAGLVRPDRTPRAHQQMLAAGYIWDKGQNGYFKAKQDENGKMVPDYSQGASPEFQSALLQRTGEGQMLQPAPASMGGGSIAERTNNPLNLKRAGANTGNASDFRQFSTIGEGFTAAWDQLKRYQNRDGLTTPAQMIAKWAPSSDGNNVQKYIATVQQTTGLNPYQPININDPRQAAVLIKGMAVAESPIGQRVSAEQIFGMLSGGAQSAPGGLASADPRGLRSQPQGAAPAMGPARASGGESAPAKRQAPTDAQEDYESLMRGIYSLGQGIWNWGSRGQETPEEYLEEYYRQN